MEALDEEVFVTVGATVCVAGGVSEKVMVKVQALIVLGVEKECVLLMLSVDDGVRANVFVLDCVLSFDSDSDGVPLVSVVVSVAVSATVSEPDWDWVPNESVLDALPEYDKVMADFVVTPVNVSGFVFETSFFVSVASNVSVSVRVAMTALNVNDPVTLGPTVTSAVSEGFVSENVAIADRDTTRRKIVCVELL
jgi:hypothetical protein